MFSRAKQFTEERLGKAERTENDPSFENLAKKTDKVKGYTEKLVKNTEAVLVPNPGKSLSAARPSLIYFWLYCSGSHGNFDV